MNLESGSLTSRQLRQAAAIKERIEELEKQLRAVLGHGSNSQPADQSQKPSAGTIGRRKMSAAARARLSAIARERWKKAKAAGKKAL
jgi:hypothetical protein